MSVADLPPLPPKPSARVIGPPPGWNPPPPPAPATGPVLTPAPPASPASAPSGVPAAPSAPLLSPPPAITGPPLSAPVSASTPVIAPPTVAEAVDVVMEETRMVSRSRHIVVLNWDDGTQTRINVPTRIGRNPAASDNERVVAIPDTTSSLSKTHARLDVTDAGPVIEDMHSTNGVQIQRDGVRFPVPSETPTPLQPGDVLVFGLRTATVTVNP